MTVYYNENDPFAAAWLRNLIAAGHLPAGDVDDRSIKDVRPDDISGYRQTHFFAGIGGWPYALRLAGWPDDRPVWTGSCPCQPFSAAGKRKGEADDRHLWPEFRRLIAECRPATIFGEQVASKDGRRWLAGVCADMEALGYAVGAADLCAASAGAPHIRQRLWWVADADGGLAGNRHLQPGRQYGQQPQDGGAAGRLGDAESERYAKRELGNQAGAQHETFSNQPIQQSDERCWRRNVADAGAARRLGHAAGEQAGGAGQPWRQSDTVDCADGKTRRIEPGSFPLAHGVPGRVGRLRGYGNAIVPQVAVEFVKAYRESVLGL